MVDSSIVSSIRLSSRRTHFVALAILLALLFALGAWPILSSFPRSSTVAGTAATTETWWPAAAASVLTMLATRQRRLRVALLICVVSTASSLVAGHPLPIAVGFGLGAAVEALVVAAMVGSASSAILDSFRQVGRFVVAVLTAVVTMGVIVALSAWLAEGADPLRTFATIILSHASAILCLAPFALVRFQWFDPSVRWERRLQALCLGAVLVVVFRPGQALPLTFLPLPFLVWGAERFGVQYMSWEILGTGVIVSSLTAAGGGPMAHVADDPNATSFLVQLVVIVYSMCALFTATGSTERERLVRRVGANEQLLRGGLVGAQIGLLIIQTDDTGSIRVIEGNDMASRLLGLSLDTHATPVLLDLPDGDPFSEAIRAMRDSRGAGSPGGGASPGGGGSTGGGLPGASQELEIATGSRQLQVFIARVPTEEAAATLTVQVIDVTARHNAEAAMKSALETEHEASVRLEDLSRQKDDFVASVTHELRTPITSIVGYAEELEDSSLEENQDGYVRVILRNAHRLAHLVEDLLELSRLTSGTDFRPTEFVSVNDVITECVQDLTPIAQAKGVALTARLGAGLPRLECVRADPIRIVTNLISNAVKFTPRDGEVTVTSSMVGGAAGSAAGGAGAGAAGSAAGGGVRLSVEDTGVGIPPVEIERVLERFYRASTSTALPGTGLGLALVKGLVDSMGGSLLIESDGVLGTQVTVVLPTEPPIQSQPPAAAADAPADTPPAAPTDARPAGPADS